jgi:plastocyanin
MSLPTRRSIRSVGITLAAAMLASLLVPLGAANAAVTRRVPQEYATIQAAIDASASGDTVVVAPGVYPGTVTISKSLTLVGEIFDTADPRNNAAVLDGAAEPVVIVPRNVTPPPSIVGLTIRNGFDGIRSQSPAAIEYNYFTGNGDALDLSKGAGGTISGNVFVGGRDDAVDINHPVNDFLVEDNQVVGSGGDGVEMRLNDDVLTRTVEIAFRGNSIVGSANDGIQIIDYFEDTSRLVVIEHNLFEDVTLAAVGLLDNAESGEDFRAASIREPIRVFNNTFLNNDHGISGGDKLIALNNIFQGHRVAMKNVDASSIASYNLFWSNVTDTLGSVVDPTTTVVADPFLLADGGLASGSPAIDAGTASFTWEGEVVMQQPSSSFEGAAPDLGWKERRTGQGPGIEIASFTPASGPPGTDVTITGSGFTDANDVWFNETSSTFEVLSDSRISAVVPTTATSGPIGVRSAGGTAISGASFSVTADPATSVTVSDGGFNPSTFTAGLGDALSWTFNVSDPWTVTDLLGLGAKRAPLFDSGPKTAGETFTFNFDAAGGYAYTSTLASPPSAGSVDVPVAVDPPSGSASSTFSVEWSGSAIPGYRFMPQVRFRPDPSSSWSRWQAIGSKQTDELGVAFAPDRGTGRYQFRSRLRNVATRVTSEWSSPTSLDVA